MFTVRAHVPLALFSTFKTGGAARFFAEIETVEDLRKARAFSLQEKIPILLLGGGSNMLFPDEGVDALVLRIKICGVSFHEEGIRVIAEAGAGEVWNSFVEETTARALWGIENLSAIPGTVGGTPVQNVGAYGTEVKDTINAVTVYDFLRDETRTLSNEECAFRYRESIFKHTPHLAITAVSFALSSRSAPRLGYRDLVEYFAGMNTAMLTSAAISSAVRAIRAKKFPDLSLCGTAGSFFKNLSLSKEEVCRLETYFGAMPPFYEEKQGSFKVPLAWVLERLGWKGKREGAVGAHSAQPIVLVNYGGATTGEILAFAERIREDVKEKLNITIFFEVRVVSPDSFFMPPRM